jgi:hypothetical protein
LANAEPSTPNKVVLVEDRDVAIQAVEENIKACSITEIEALATVKKLIKEFKLSKRDIRGKAMKKLGS